MILAIYIIGFVFSAGLFLYEEKPDTPDGFIVSLFVGFFSWFAVLAQIGAKYNRSRR
jgi:hypothetical protein